MTNPLEYANINLVDSIIIKAKGALEILYLPHYTSRPSSGLPDENMIRKTKKGYILYSRKTPRRRLGGPYKTRAAAEKRERQVQYFKHRR